MTQRYRARLLSFVILICSPLCCVPAVAVTNFDLDGKWQFHRHYGGIVRDVWLSVSEPTLAAVVTTRVFLENFSGQPVSAHLKAKIVSPAGGVAGGDETVLAEETVSLKPGASEQTVALRIEGVKLWHFDHPNLYRLDLELIDAHGKPLDSRSDTFGARTLELRDRHLYLNGERVRLSGITRHEDSPWEGLAETRGTIRHDVGVRLPTFPT